MIDLTKPIRRKGSKRAEDLLDGDCVFFVSSKGDLRVLRLSELERDYENIPEPRKPHRYSDKVVYVENQMSGFRTLVPPNLSLIEWPKDAPLPDWPEGYD